MVSHVETALRSTPAGSLVVGWGEMWMLICAIAAGDLPMTRVKMNAKHEYEFIANFKVMQNVFKAKKIDKVRLFVNSL